MTAGSNTIARELLTFADLAPYLLLKNGNFLYKIPYHGDWAVLKVYFGTTGPLTRLQKSLANLLSGQTSYKPRTRLRVERECLEVWRRHGFRVFKTFDQVEIAAPGCPPGGYQLFEYVSAPKLIHFLPDENIPIEERFQVYRRFLKEWSRRHELAISLREPRLVHENGDFKHVLIIEDGFLWFDFEMVYRKPEGIHYHVAHEILQYLWHILKRLPRDLVEPFLEETIAHYPVRERLALPHEYFYRHPNPFLRLARALDRRCSPRARKETSKYRVALKLKERLDRKT